VVIPADQEATVAVTLTGVQRGLLAGAAAAALLLGAFAAGMAQGGAPAAAAAAPSASSKITVTGTGIVSGTPDQLGLSMGVQTSGGTVSTALDRANAAVRAVTRALIRNGVRASDIQTSGLSIQPNYGGSSQVPDGYGVSESIQVTLRALTTAGRQISAAVAAGGNATVVDGVSLNLSDTSGLLAAARTRAMADARAKASAYARALGRSLGPVVSVSEQAAPQLYPVLGGAVPSAAGRVSPVPVSPGSQQVTVTVTAVFQLG
jgi:uncharacterized protein YggE